MFVLTICSQAKVLRGIAQLEVVDVEAHGLFKGRNAAVAHLGLISRHVLRLTFRGCRSFTFRGCRSLTFLGYCSLTFSSCRSLIFRLGLLSFLASLLDMRLRVPVHVEPVATVILEEELLKVSLELNLCDCRQKGDFTFLSIKDVSVGG